MIAIFPVHYLSALGRRRFLDILKPSTARALQALVLLAVPVMPCLADTFPITLIGSTATQIAFSYPVPAGGGYCAIQASTSATLSPLAVDVNEGIFAQSDIDVERSSTVVQTVTNTRMVVIGQRTAQYATGGPFSGVRHFSRALQAATTYYFNVTCPGAGTSSSAFSASTTNIPLGQTYGDPWLSDPSHPGDQPWPESVGGLNPESFIDPLTGTLQYRIGLRGNAPQVWNLQFGSAFNQSQTTPCDTAGPWTSPCAMTAGSGSTTVGGSTAPLVLRLPLAANYSPWNSSYGELFSLDQLSVALTGSVNSANTNLRVLDVCLSLNGGASCASSVKQITMRTSSSQRVAGVAPSSPWVPTQFGADPWVLDTNPRLNAQESSTHSGTATVSGNTVTNNPAASGTPGSDLFSLYWVTGGNGHIRLSANNDACIAPPANTTSTEYAITGFIDGNNLTVAGTPPTGTVYWCENNFTVMVWRDQAPTDASTVTLTSAVLNMLGSTPPAYPDNGAGTACFNSMIYGGYFCLYGGLYWVNPAGPAVAYYGQPQGAGIDGSGAPVANSWTRVTAPTPESASIDQTQSAFTFYVVAYDPAGAGPLVIQGVFNPASAPTQTAAPQAATGVPQIQNAVVSTTTPYSVSWNNGLTFTNLTPQSSVQEGVFQQMAAFDPTFVASYYSGMNCGLTGAASQGVFFFACLSIGGDSPAWIFAFAAGDGNPAHAGLAGGPQIIGAINTFNTPQGPVAPLQGALTGVSLHAIAEAGETGWIAISANSYSPINTSATNIPASGVDCSEYGLPAGNDCYLIQIDSQTIGGVTGYEPYFASPSAPFLGTPGELRTTQIGDTACVATIAAGSCNWAAQANELMTLEIKNYGGTAGAWVFQRNAYGTEQAAAGPLALWWQSYQSAVPAGSTPESAALQVFWSPLAGCAGAPDPHGNCLLQDNNEFHGHAEWRNGGESEVVNVPQWSQPIWGWPFVYQTILGPVSCILGLPFANVTVDQVTSDDCVNSSNSGVNYVAAEPPFVGVYGHPWGFDGGNHPNAAGANAPANESIRAFDNIPVQGGQNEPTFAAVTGQLYAATPSSVIGPDDIFGSGSTVAINRKLMATGASCGSHPLIDLSGPGSSIATDASGSYTYCIARANGECAYPGATGSTVGQVYVNCPGVVSPSCAGNGIHGGTPLGVGNDICVGNIGNAADSIIQYSLDATDYAGASRRALVSATARLRMVYGFENNQMLPDNSWILYRQEWLNYQRPDMWMAQVPSYPAADSYQRSQFIPETVTVPAYNGANAAVVEFGYQEYGLPKDGSTPATLTNCTTRRDPCWANTGTVSTAPPFYFKSEYLQAPRPESMPCPVPGGCQIVVPAISQRMLFYRVQYYNGNKYIATGPLGVVAVP